MIKVCDIGSHLVYSDGKVWSKRYKRFLKEQVTYDGYIHIVLSSKRYLLHQVLALCFLDWRSDMEVNHINKNRKDNRLENIEMITHANNVRYSRAKKVIRSDGKIYDATLHVVKDGFSKYHVTRCCRGDIDSYAGYKWRYYYGE